MTTVRQTRLEVHPVQVAVSESYADSSLDVMHGRLNGDLTVKLPGRKDAVVSLATDGFTECSPQPHVTGVRMNMTTAPLEPSRNDPNIRPDMKPDGTPEPTPGLDTAEPDTTPAESGNPTAPEATES